MNEESKVTRRKYCGLEHSGVGGARHVIESECVENTGDADLVFLEMFKTAYYEDNSLAE